MFGLGERGAFLMRANAGAKGFTLLEFALVVVIAGILMIAAIRAYMLYISASTYKENIYKLNSIVSAMNLYANNPAKNRYPCPADPSLPASDPNAGMEVCAALTLALPSCNAAGWPYANSKANSICHLYGARKTASNVTANNDPIVIGGVPFKTLASGSNNQNAAQLNLVNALDPWNYQFTYAVTDSETTKADPTMGAIDLKSERGVELLLPPQSAVFVIAGHGQDHNGAYNSQGKVTVPCGATATAQDNYNCNYGNTFVMGLRDDSKDQYHFDDVVSSAAGYINNLWDFTGVGGNDLHNVNVGNVGVGTLTATPAAALELKNNSVQIPIVNNNKVCDPGNVSVCWVPSADAPKICDINGANCFSPAAFGGLDAVNANNTNPSPAPTGAANSTTQCPAGSGSTVNVMTGLSFDAAGNGKVTCTAVSPPAITVGAHCSGADDSPATSPQYYVTGVMSGGYVCATVGFDKCQECTTAGCTACGSCGTCP
jgi:prepilin-type N-terminal cleavage/methylation domain-containing protein